MSEQATIEASISTHYYGLQIARADGNELEAKVEETNMNAYLASLKTYLGNLSLEGAK